MRRKRKIWRISKGRQLNCFRTLDRKCFRNVKISSNSLLRNPSQALNSSERVCMSFWHIYTFSMRCSERVGGGGEQHITDNMIFRILHLLKNRLYLTILLSKITRERAFHTQKISSPKSLSKFCSYQCTAPSALDFRGLGAFPSSKAFQRLASLPNPSADRPQNRSTVQAMTEDF